MSALFCSERSKYKLFVDVCLAGRSLDCPRVEIFDARVSRARVWAPAAALLQLFTAAPRERILIQLQNKNPFHQVCITWTKGLRAPILHPKIRNYRPDGKGQERPNWLFIIDKGGGCTACQNCVENRTHQSYFYKQHHVSQLLCSQKLIWRCWRGHTTCQRDMGAKFWIQWKVWRLQFGQNTRMFLLPPFLNCYNCAIKNLVS